MILKSNDTLRQLLSHGEIAGRDRKIDSCRKGYAGTLGENISIFHGCMVWIEQSVTRVTDRHHEACRVTAAEQ